MKEWVSLSEAAELEGVEANTIVIRIRRQKTDSTVTAPYIVKTEPNASGGRDLVFIATSSLSEAAQAKLKRRERDALARAVRIEQEGKEPWYFDIPIAWYISEYKTEYHEKVALAGEIEKYLEQVAYQGKNKTEFCKAFAAEHLGLSSNQFRRYINRYQEGLFWAECKCAETGANYEYFKVLALCTPPKKGKHAKLTPEIMARIENLWAAEEHHQNLQSMQMIYEDLTAELEASGADWIPSYNTVRRYCNELSSKYPSAASLLKNGVREWKNQSMVKRLRNTGELDVMELWQGDAHTFDCWIKAVQPNGKVTACRPYLVAFIDTRSRCLAGWGICVQPNAEVIKRVLIHAIYPKEGSPISGVPKAILIDNGKDFTAQTLTGRARSERFDVDGEIKGFYKSIGIESDARALPYQPWSKGEIERFFGALCSKFSKKFKSYTGTLTGSRTDAKVKKDILGMLERGELHTMDEFAEMFSAYLEKYHMTKHSGLQKQREPSPYPIKVYENAKRYERAAPPLEYALMLLGTTVERRVYNTGLEFSGRSFMSEDLARYIGEKVTVRYQEEMPNMVKCWASDGSFIGEAYSYDKLSMRAEGDDEKLMEHILSQKRQLRGVREDIDNLRRSLAERSAQEAYPEISNMPQKVVSLPQDTQYLEEAKRVQDARKQVKKPKREPINDFMRQQAEKALERLSKAQ